MMRIAQCTPLWCFPLGIPLSASGRWLDETDGFPLATNVREVLVHEYLIYKATSPSGKVYVGLTSKTLSERRQQHIAAAASTRTQQKARYFYNALQKYGSDFVWEVVEEGLVGREKANERERFHISVLRADEAPFGYNGTSGGDAGTCANEQARQRMSDAARARGVTPQQMGNLQLGRLGEAQRKRSLKSSRFCNKTHSAESRSRMAESQRHVEHTQEWVQKIKEANRHPILRSDGRIFSSARDAARQMGLSDDAVAKAIRQNRPCAGFNFESLPKHPGGN